MRKWQIRIAGEQRRFLPALIAPEQRLRFYAVLAKFYEERTSVSDFLAHARLALFGVNPCQPVISSVGQSEVRT